MKKIKIGQIGIGHNHAEGKMAAFRKFPELFEVIGYAEENEEWLKRRGNLAVYRDLPRKSVDEILREADAVAVESDVWNLDSYARLCVDTGKHVHMDKPASGSLESYKKLLDDAEKKQLVFQLGYMYRYNPAVQKCFALAQSGALGEIYSIHAEMSTFHNKEYKTWLTNFGGSILYILGSHLVDLIVYLLGEPEKVTSFLKHTQLDGVDLEDNNLAVLEYKNALAHIYVSSVEVNGWGRRQLVVSGSKGTVSILPLEKTCTMTYADLAHCPNAYEDMKTNIAVSDVPTDCRYDHMVHDFYDYIAGTKTNPFSYAHEYAVQKVLSAVVGGVKIKSTNLQEQ